MYIRQRLCKDTNIYFAEIRQDPREEGVTGIIVADPDFEINLYCSIEQAEKLVKQLQKEVTRFRLETLDGGRK